MHTLVELVAYQRDLSSNRRVRRPRHRWSRRGRLGDRGKAVGLSRDHVEVLLDLRDRIVVRVGADAGVVRFLVGHREDLPGHRDLRLRAVGHGQAAQALRRADHGFARGRQLLVLANRVVFDVIKGVLPDQLTGGAVEIERVMGGSEALQEARARGDG